MHEWKFQNFILPYTPTIADYNDAYNYSNNDYETNRQVPLLKLLTLYMLWRTQFLLGFYAGFCVLQILILLKL